MSRKLSCSRNGFWFKTRCRGAKRSSRSSFKPVEGPRCLYFATGRQGKASFSFMFAYRSEHFYKKSCLRGNFSRRKDQMMRFALGDTVAFRRDIVAKCSNPCHVASVRGIVKAISGEWLFLEDTQGKARVMPMKSMAKVARSGVILELV